MQNFKIIVAMDENKGIAKDGKIPWNFPNDLNHFYEMTNNSVVIMGKNTWDSLPLKFKPLPERVNIVISGKPFAYLSNETLKKHKINATIRHCRSFGESLYIANKFKMKIFAIGGKSIYEESLKHANCTEMYVTEIKGNYNCDLFFPEIPDGFKKIRQLKDLDDGNLVYYWSKK